MDGHFGRSGLLTRRLVAESDKFNASDAPSLVMALTHLSLPGTVTRLLHVDRTFNYTLKSSTFKDISSMAHRVIITNPKTHRLVAIEMERTSNLPGTIRYRYNNNFFPIFFCAAAMSC